MWVKLIRKCRLSNRIGLALVPPTPDHPPGKDIALYFVLPLFAVTSYAADYKEREKMRHRF